MQSNSAHQCMKCGLKTSFEFCKVYICMILRITRCKVRKTQEHNVSYFQRRPTIFTAANASLPTPRPTKMPSAMLSTEPKSKPSNVGTNSCTNSFGMLVRPKSIASLCINGGCCYYLEIFSKTQKLE